MKSTDVPEYLRERYAQVGADSHHYTYEEWCAIYPLTLTAPPAAEALTASGDERSDR